VDAYAGLAGAGENGRAGTHELIATHCCRTVRDTLIAFMAATAQAQAEATKEAQRAGIDYAKDSGVYRGRKPSFTRDQLRAVQDMLSQGAGVSGIASATGLTRQTIYRIKDDPVGAEAIMARWEREAA
jgi:putative DNA-invertase from lambdoid prophage Rac